MYCFMAEEDLKIRKKVETLIRFTNYDTVFVGKEECTREEYFDNLEKQIKNRTIKNFKYNSESDSFTFENLSYAYKILIKENTYNSRILFSLMQLSNEIDKEVETEKNTQKKIKLTEEEMRRKIIYGNVDTEQTKKFYIKELKGKNSIKTLFKRVIEKFKGRVLDTWHVDDKEITHKIIATLSVFIVIWTGLGGLFSNPLLFKAILPSLSITAISFYGIVAAENELPFEPFNVIKALALFPVDTVKELVIKPIIDKEYKLTKHKIKALENMKLPTEMFYEEKEREENKKVNQAINNELNKIYEKIVTFEREERKNYYSKLSNLIKKYRNDLKKVPTKGLTLINQQTIDMAFINSLNEFSLQIENAIKDKFDVEKKLEVNMIDKQIEELNNRKAILENTKLESGYQYRK